MFVPIEDGDAAAIVALMNRAYRGPASQAAWNTEAGYLGGSRITADLLRELRLATPDGRFLKWVDAPGAELLGCVWLAPLGGAGWYLGSLTVDPDRQNAGLGATLLAAAERWVRDGGGTRIRMTVVNVREALIAWYARRGYRPTGETEPFPYGDDRFGTPLRDDLHFIVLEKELDLDQPH